MRIRSILLRSIRFLVLLTFFLVPWWLRPDALQDAPYYLGFLISFPVIATIALWMALGGPGIRPAFRDQRRWFLIFFALLVGWSLLSPLWAKYIDYSSTAAQQFGLAAAFALVATCMAPKPRDVALALGCGLVFQAVIVVFQMALQNPIGLDVFGEFAITSTYAGLSVITVDSMRLVRPYGLTVHPNVVGGFLVVALLALIGGWFIRQGQQNETDVKTWRIVARMGILALGLWSILLTFSRSAWIALVVGCITIYIFWRRTHTPLARRRIYIALAGALVIIVLFATSYWDFVWIRATVGQETTELRSISDRIYFSKIALQLIHDHPIIGVGIGMFPWESHEIINEGPYRGWLAGENVHNMILLVFSELGVIGFILWALALLAAFRVAWQKLRDPFAIGLFAGVIAMLTISMVDHYFWSILHFIILLWATLGIVLANSSCEQAQAEPS